MPLKRPPESWHIDSYQVPVPTGDCSIHLLVDVSGTGNQTANTIERSIIVDGGEEAGAASKAIQDAVDLFSGKYSNDSTTFNFWLVTHWDKDHYAGALKYLTKDDTNDDIKDKPKVFGPVQFDDNQNVMLSEEQEKVRRSKP